jgi:hypothetical protein
MPEKRTIEKARRAKRAGKASTTQAGEFVREEVHRIRRGAHGARSAGQGKRTTRPRPRVARAVSKAKARTRRGAQYAYSAGQGKRTTRPRPRVARAVSKALKREPTVTAARPSLSRHATRAASRRTAAQRSEAARKAARTKGFAARSAAARKAARTRARNRIARGG